jgi:hypothetical protein
VILEVCFARLQIITHHRGPTVVIVVNYPHGKARVNHGKHDGSDTLLGDNIHILLIQLSIGIGTVIVMVGSVCPQCMGEICKTLMTITSISAIQMGSSLVHQILPVLSC